MANPSKPADSRPIANRRRMIGSRSSSDIAGTAAAADTTTSPAVTPTKPADDGEISDVTPSKTAVDKTVDEKTDSVEKTEEKATEQPANVNTVAAVTTPASKETATTTTPNTTETKKSVLPPAKSIEEVEREIAEATMKSDEKTLKKDDENTVKTGRFGRKSAGGATSTDGKISAAAANALKVKPIAIDPSNVMRLIRVIMIILLAAFTGYRTVENSRLEAIKVKSMESLMVSVSYYVSRKNFIYLMLFLCCFLAFPISLFRPLNLLILTSAMPTSNSIHHQLPPQTQYRLWNLKTLLKHVHGQDTSKKS